MVTIQPGSLNLAFMQNDNSGCGAMLWTELFQTPQMNVLKA